MLMYQYFNDFFSFKLQNPPSFHSSPLTFPVGENLNIVLITLEPKSDKDPACPLGLGNIFQYEDPLPRYPSQQHQAPIHPVEHCNDSSVDYGVVSIAPKSNAFREEEDEEKRYNRREDGDNLKGKCQRCTAEDTYEKKQWSNMNGQFAGFYAPQARSPLPLTSTQICMLPHMVINTQTDMSILAQAHGTSPLNSVLQRKSQVDREAEDREALFFIVKNNPQTGLFHCLVNAQTNKMTENVADTEEDVRIRTDRNMDKGVEEACKREKVPLLSAYASQDMVPHFHTELSDSLPDDYGIVRVNTAHSADEDDYDNNEEEEGAIRINWDLKTNKLDLPEMAMYWQRGMTGSSQGDSWSEDQMRGEDEEVMMGRPRLENVFVRQPSEEDAAREMERGGATAWEVEEFVTKWNLVIPQE